VATVLVVGDVAALRRDVEAALAGPDLDVVQAASGPEAVALVREGGIDLVVSDMQVGHMGGMAITLELRNLESYGAAESVPVLLIVDRRPDVFLARRAGADGFVVKPLDPLVLRRAARALLAGEEYEDASWRPATVRVGPSAG
jgi:CheY-like chemotaxis protein